MISGHPVAEIEITENLVHDLLSEQFTTLAHLPLTHLGTGWDNAIYRLGDELTVRLPRREAAAQLMVNEQTWLPQLAKRLPIPISAALYTGVPTSNYPWHWSVLPFFVGDCADECPLSDLSVDIFAHFLLKLHQIAPPEAPQNLFRGVSLSKKLEPIGKRISNLKAQTNFISKQIEKIWFNGQIASTAMDRRWIHGDLHAQNVLGTNGVVSAVIDWGDITAGDVATDLASAWTLFSNQRDRQQLLEIYQPDSAAITRAMAWAVSFGVVLTETGLVNNPRHASQGQRILARLEEDCKM